LGKFGGESTLEVVDPGSTFSDTVTDKVRVKVHSYYGKLSMAVLAYYFSCVRILVTDSLPLSDPARSVPDQGKYMFWYKVGIFNEGNGVDWHADL
jgi:hypothetical protein